MLFDFMSQRTRRQRYDRTAPEPDIAKDTGEVKRRDNMITLENDTAAAHPGEMQKAAMTARFASPGFIPGRGISLGKRDSA